MLLSPQIEQFIETLFPTQDPKSVVRAANGGVDPTPDANTPAAPAVKRNRAGNEEATFKELMFMSLAVLVGITAAGSIMVRFLPNPFLSTDNTSSLGS